MYKTCKTEQSARRQRELEQGLLTLMSKRRYEDISVSDLCQHLNIPRKSFYRYFSSKDGALFALLDHTLISFYDTPELGIGGTAIGDLERFFAFWESQKPLLDALYHSSLSGIIVERATALALREQLMPRHIMGLEKDIKTLAMGFSLSGLFSIVLQWHRQNFTTPAHQMAALATKLLTEPLIRR